MLNLEESLKLKTVPELKDIAREYEISGFSLLKKEVLVTLLMQNMKSKEFQEKLRDKLTDTMLLFLDLILEEGNARKYSDIKIDYIEFKSATTFYKNYNLLKTLGIMFDGESKDGETISYIPQDLLNIINTLLADNKAKLEKQKATGEETIEGGDSEEDISLYASFKTIDGLFYSSFLPIENLRHLLLNKDLDAEGTKKELINRVLYESNLSLDDILDQIFSKIILQDICASLQIPKSGTKENVINRIIEKLPPQKPNLIKSKKKATIKSVGSSATDVKTRVAPKTVIEAPKATKIDDENLYDNPEKFIRYLKTIKPPKPRDERDLANTIYGVLMGKFGDKVHIEESTRRGRSRYDLTLAETVLIELKYAKNKNAVITGMGQIQHYLGQTQKYKYGILGVYDGTTSRNLNSQFSMKFPNYYIIFW